MLPLVSVIIPTYKRSEFLTRAINSVLKQTYKNLEVIVVDDNNKNDEYSKLTQTLLETYINRNEIKIIQHDENRGISAARNTGIKIAKGQYITFLDDDDEFFPEKIELQVNIFKKSKENVGLVYGAYEEINVSSGKKRIILPKYKNNVYNVLGINHIGTPSTIMLSNLAIKKVGEFDINLNHKEDIDYYFRLSKYFEVLYTEKVVTRYYFHSRSASKNDNDRLDKMLRFLKKYKNELKKPKIRWSEIQERLGELYFLNNYKRKAIVSFISAYSNRPLRIKILIKIIFTLFGKKTLSLIK